MMVAALIAATTETVGLWFLVAVALQFAAVYAEQAGVAHKPDGQVEKREGFGGFALALTTTLTPAFLFLHGFFLTADSALAVRVTVLSAVIAAVLLGAIIGRLVGMGWKGGAGVMRTLALPLGLAAMVVAIYACRPSLEALIDLFQGHVSQLPVRPV